MKHDVRGHSVTPSRLNVEFPTIANNMAGTRTFNTVGTLAPRA
jgi:hypothetical protein